MATYTNLELVPLATGLDEIALHLGLPRIEGESLLNFQRRLILETRERSGPTEREFIASLSRRVGEFDVPVFRIDLDLDGDGVPLAPDPYLEITSSYIRAYSNRAANLIDVELNLYDRDDGYFLRDVFTAFNTSSFFSITVLDEDYTYKLSQRLRYGNSQIHVVAEALDPSFETKLLNDRVTDFYPDNRAVFITEKDTLADVDQDGDYYVDYENGVVFSYATQSGIASYTYMEFPYTVYWQAIRAYPYNDPDKKYFHKDTLLSDSTGLEEYVLLNDIGADIANEILSVHPLTWGR